MRLECCSRHDEESTTGAPQYMSALPDGLASTCRKASVL